MPLCVLALGFGVGAGLLGGAALGLAVVARYPSAIFVLAALGWLAALALVCSFAADVLWLWRQA